MSQFIVENIDNRLLKPMQNFLDALVADIPIPKKAQRMALNIHWVDRPFQPIEIYVERSKDSQQWRLKVIATFDVICTEIKQKKLSLYFNFAGLWFYHPETKQCNLNHPEIQALLSGWLQATTSALIHSDFNVQIKVIA